MLKLSERLITLRKEHKLTQESMAEELEISLNAYCRFEAGEREPNASTLIQIADFYNVTLDYLVGRSEKR